ncbi:hypothetical protein MLD38_025380 [Melastoma candidum]|uniref:Uncharacterized protein n=1 Tax=Melastoma candidum TaxID=119954 RepID=A0ACB9NWY6_9MYRT|nr:hypothetical protein MLD38_025380 [Melastoma candidum]
MATSLEELLAEEGFRGKRSMLKSRASFGSDTAVPRRTRGQANTETAFGTRLKTGRSQSDASRYGLKSSFSRGESSKGSRLRDSGPVTRRGVHRESHRLADETTETSNMKETARFDLDHVDDLGNDIPEEPTEKLEHIKDIYLNEMRESPRKDDTAMSKRTALVDGASKVFVSKDKQANEREGRYRQDPSREKEMKPGDTPKKYTLQMGQSDNTHDSSSGGSSSINRKKDEHVQARKHGPSASTDSIPALDEVAIQATISILTSYCKRFLNDEGFRISIHDNCFSSLDFIDPEKCSDSESKVIFNLLEAIKTVEEATNERASSNELKRALLQLSVITGLNSSGLVDGFNCGVPNYKLSACAHLYISVVYKLQKKNRVSAKHLLQVFCDSPFQARTALLPELWENLFYPHLSHLEIWYNQEADSLVSSPNKERKRKVLDKVFNEILDSATYQFAVYYKNWLMEGFEAPSIPSINVPSLSFRGVMLEDSPSNPTEPSNAPTPLLIHTTVGNNLSEASLGLSSNPSLEDISDDLAENCLSGMRDPWSTGPEIKRISASSSETIKHVDERSVENAMKDEASVIGDPPLRVDMEKKGPQKVGFSTRIASDKQSGGHNVLWQATMDDYSIQVPPTHLTESSYSFKETSQVPMISAERALFKIEQAFICPLTGQLYQDPVTLVTGQTYERAAIVEWFDQGNETCPVTGTALEYMDVPPSNVVMKRTVEILMSYYRKKETASSNSKIVGPQEEDGLQDSGQDDEALTVLEKLLIVSDKEEKLANAKRLVSLGCLRYLIQKLEFGLLPKKIQMAELLLCCLEADARCRNQILEGLNKNVLLELLHNKQNKGRSLAVSLLIELLCMSRRKDSVDYFSGLAHEEIINAMHTLLLYLQSSPHEEKAMIAVLLLHLDLLVETRKYSIYREEAVDAISLALELSFDDEYVRANCSNALTVLGRRFLCATKLYPQSGIELLDYIGSTFETIPRDEAHDISVDSSGDEELGNQLWVKNLLLSLLGSGKKSFMYAISRCFSSGDAEFARVCLTTVACLSFALSSLSEAEFHLSAYSTLVPLLKGKLENGDHIEDKILASFSLLNFSRISECRVLLMKISKEIASPLRRLGDATWTAKRLYGIISGNDF